MAISETSPKRIVILTHAAERHYYFCNKLIEGSQSVVGVVVGGKYVRQSRKAKLIKALKKHPVKYAKNKILNLIFASYGARFAQGKACAESNAFAGEKAHFENNHAHLLLGEVTPERGSLNDPYFVDLIQKAKPDIIVVMGTCLIGGDIIKSADHIINMHTGLSPYYRGGNTNAWPIIEGDLGHFGVTIHKMSLGIDSGDIIFTRRIAAAPGDDYGSINCKSIILGTELMLQTIALIKQGQCKSVPQWSKGKIFHSIDWNNYIACRYYKAHKDFMSRHVEAEKSGAFDSIQTVENGEITCSGA